MASKSRYSTSVAGVTYEGRQQVVASLARGQSVRLKREPSNPHDRNAIRVECVDGRQIGYIKRELALEIAPVLDVLGGSLSASVTEITGGSAGYNYGVTITFDLSSAAAAQATQTSHKIALPHRRPRGRRVAEYRRSSIEKLVWPFNDSLVIQTSLGTEQWRVRGTELQLAQFSEGTVILPRAGEAIECSEFTSSEKPPPDHQAVGGFLLLHSDDFLDMEPDNIKQDYSVWLYDVKQSRAICLARNCSYNCLQIARLSCNGSYVLVLAEPHWRSKERTLLLFETRPVTHCDEQIDQVMPEAVAMRKEALRWIETDFEREIAVQAGIRTAHFGNQSGNLLGICSNSVLSLLSLPQLQSTDILDCGTNIVEFCFSPDDRRVAVADEAGYLSIWDLRMRQRLASVGGYLFGSIADAAVDSEMGHVVVHTDQHTWHGWEIDSGNPLPSVQATGAHFTLAKAEPAGSNLWLSLQPTADSKRDAVPSADLPSLIEFRLEERTTCETRSTSRLATRMIQDDEGILQFVATHVGGASGSVVGMASGCIVATVTSGDELYPPFLQFTVFWDTRFHTVRLVRGRIAAQMPTDLLAIVVDADSDYSTQRNQASRVVLTSHTAHPRGQVQVNGQFVQSVVFGKDSGLLGVLHGPGHAQGSTLSLFDLATSCALCDLDTPKAKGFNFSPDGSQVITWSDNTVSLYGLG